MAITAGSSLNTVPSSQKQTLSTNYLDFTGTTDNTFAQQYLPDLMEKEAEIFGPRTVSGFLSQVGAEEPMSSDQVVWSEQSRLHISVKGTVATAGDTNGTFTVTSDIDGNNASSTPAFTLANHGVRVNDIVLIASAGIVTKCKVVEAALAKIEVEPYDKADLTGHATTAGGSTLLVVGSEYGKGTKYYSNSDGATESDSRGANEPTFKSFSNKPIIMKDYYEVSGSDTARIGWVEVAAEDGTAGYLWYLKAEAETRLRFADYMEMAMIEAEKTHADSVIGISHGSTDLGAGGAGTEGLFKAITTRGNVTSGITGLTRLLI